jgi:hypothetical protein
MQWKYLWGLLTRIHMTNDNNYKRMMYHNDRHHNTSQPRKWQCAHPEWL